MLGSKLLFHVCMCVCVLVFFLFCPRGSAGGLLVPGPGIEPVPPTVGLPRWFSGKESAGLIQETREIQFLPLSREDPLEEEMAAHSSILVLRIPWTEEPGSL